MQKNTLIKAASTLGAALLLSGIGSAQAADYTYTGGLATTCTSTCDSFASLSAPPSASTLEGAITVDVGANDSFVAADVTSFTFEVFNPGAPVEPFDGTNPATANPLPLDSNVAAVRDTITNGQGTFTTGGNTDADGNFTDGRILLEFTQPPFSDNGAWVVLDVGTGTAQVCLFFSGAGCVPGATETVVIQTRGFLNAGGNAFDYNGGKAVLCTGTCDGFASLDGPPTPSTLEGSVDINVGASASFAAADVTDFNFLVTSPAAPLEPFNGTNPTTANPLPVDASVAVIRASNTAGTVTTGGNTDANGDITDGTILFQFTAPPFSDNGAWVVFDVGTGTAQVCLFFDGGGCVTGATETVRFETPGFSVVTAADTDGDGVTDDVDNCTLVANPNQIDADNDGYGNLCDADLNNDCITNPLDLGIFRGVFFQADPVADLNSDGIVNPLDLGIFRSLFFAAPGPGMGTCP